LTSNRYSIGVDLGGTNLRISAYREAGAAPRGIVDSIALPTRVSGGPVAVVADMAGAIAGLLDKHGRGAHFAGVGIGTPGPLELPEGVMRNPPNLPGFDGFPLREALAQAIGEAVTIESDANLAALAEFRLGSGKTYAVPSLCMLTLGTGVGNGIILDGKILDGNNGMAGEAGHNTVIADGEDCPCGSRGCLELYASATGVQRMAAASRTLQRQQANSPEDATPPTALDVANLALQGDELALTVFVRVGTALGIGIGALVNTLNLPLYVVGGGVSAAWDLFAPRMMEELRLRSYVYRLTAPNDEESQQRSPRKTHIVRAELGSDAGILGACLLPLMPQ
jgi:glucokinase